MYGESGENQPGEKTWYSGRKRRVRDGQIGMRLTESRRLISEIGKHIELNDQLYVTRMIVCRREMKSECREKVEQR